MSVGTNLNNQKIFDHLSQKADKIVQDVMQERFKAMKHTLVHRNALQVNGKNFGNFPKSNPKPPNRESGHAFQDFVIKKSVNNRWSLYNGHRNRNDDYPYVRNLVYGTGWSAKVKDGNLQKLVRRGDKLFPIGMQRGLMPWFRQQQVKMLNEIEKRITADV